MQFGECITCLRSMNVHADIRYVGFLFSSLSEDQSNVLEFDEFQKVRVYKIMTTKTIRRLLGEKEALVQLRGSSVEEEDRSDLALLELLQGIEAPSC